MEYHKYNLLMPKDLYQKVRVQAAREGMYMAQYLRNLIIKDIENKEK